MNKLPKSVEEARTNPVKIIGIDWKQTNENIKKGYLEPYRFILNRPMSLRFDLGIELKEPTYTGTLICSID